MTKKQTLGPKSIKGKKASSRNAVKHGMTAVHPLTEQEDKRLAYVLKELRREYEPQTMTEKILVERVANICLRIERLNAIERAVFEACRREAINLPMILDQSGLNETVRNEYLQIKMSATAPKRIQLGYEQFLQFHYFLFRQVAEALKADPAPASYDDLRLLCPELDERIFTYAALHDAEFVEYAQRIECGKRRAEVVDEITELLLPKQLGVDFERSKPNEEAYKAISITPYSIKAFLNELYIRFSKDIDLAIADYKIDELREVRGHTAMPDNDTMDRLIRHSTALNNQLSKAIGELRVVKGFDGKKF
jgi:hypothetical protein